MKENKGGWCAAQQARPGSSGFSISCSGCADRPYRKTGRHWGAVAGNMLSPWCCLVLELRGDFMGWLSSIPPWMRWMQTWSWFCLSVVGWMLLASHPALTFSMIQFLQLEPMILTVLYVCVWWKMGSVSQETCLHLPRSSCLLFLCPFHWSCISCNCRVFFQSLASTVWNVIVELSSWGKDAGCKPQRPFMLWATLQGWMVVSLSSPEIKHLQGDKIVVGFFGVIRAVCVYCWARAAAAECEEAWARGGARTGGFAKLLWQVLCSACSLVVAAVAGMTFDKNVKHLVWLGWLWLLGSIQLTAESSTQLLLLLFPYSWAKFLGKKLKSQQLQKENCQQSFPMQFLRCLTKSSIPPFFQVRRVDSR